MHFKSVRGNYQSSGIVHQDNTFYKFNKFIQKLFFTGSLSGFKKQKIIWNSSLVLMLILQINNYSYYTQQYTDSSMLISSICINWYKSKLPCGNEQWIDHLVTLYPI